MQGTQADDEYNEIRKDYYKILEDADEKVHLANLMYDLVDRYLRRLDSELFKFKCELEADHNGITEILEKRSLELEGNSSSNSNLNCNSVLNNSTTNAGNSQKENRFFGSISSNVNTPQNREKYKSRPEKRRNSSTSGGPVEKRPALSTPVPPPSVAAAATTPNNSTAHSSNASLVLPTNTPTLQTSVPYNLQHIGAGNAIAVAASQAIVATQQMQQGRRTQSLKASYEAIHGSSTSGSHELMIGRELAGAAHNALQAVEREGNTLNNRRQKKYARHFTILKLNNRLLNIFFPIAFDRKVPGLSIPTNGTQPAPVSLNMNSAPPNPPPAPVSLMSTSLDPESPSASMSLGENGLLVDPSTDGDWSYDPNEPRYCVCNQVSYGDMVACDNEAVSILLCSLANKFRRTMDFQFNFLFAVSI